MKYFDVIEHIFITYYNIHYVFGYAVFRVNYSLYKTKPKKNVQLTIVIVTSVFKIFVDYFPACFLKRT